jgi:hypothetical protein
VAMLARLPVQVGSSFADCPPAGLSLLLAGVGRALVMEGGMGVVSGHAEARAFVEQWLERLAAQRELQD